MNLPNSVKLKFSAPQILYFPPPHPCSSPPPFSSSTWGAMKRCSGWADVFLNHLNSVADQLCSHVIYGTRLVKISWKWQNDRDHGPLAVRPVCHVPNCHEAKRTWIMDAWLGSVYSTCLWNHDGSPRWPRPTAVCEEYSCWSTCLTLSEGDPVSPYVCEMIKHMKGWRPWWH